jgi:hypothetical protein
MGVTLATRRCARLVAVAAFDLLLGEIYPRLGFLFDVPHMILSVVSKLNILDASAPIGWVTPW